MIGGGRSSRDSSLHPFSSLASDHWLSRRVKQPLEASYERKYLFRNIRQDATGTTLGSRPSCVYILRTISADSVIIHQPTPVDEDDDTTSASCMCMWLARLAYLPTEAGEGQGPLRGSVVTPKRDEAASQSEVLRGQLYVFSSKSKTEVELIGFG